MKTFLVGKVSKVEEIQNKDNYSSQKIEITVKSFDQNTGEEKKEEVFPVQIFNKNIAAIKAGELLGLQVKASCYIKSLKSEKDGKTFHNIALNATEIKPV
jgi:hypothetical protein